MTTPVDNRDRLGWRDAVANLDTGPITTYADQLLDPVGQANAISALGNQYGQVANERTDIEVYQNQVAEQQRIQAEQERLAAETQERVQAAQQQWYSEQISNYSTAVQGKIAEYQKIVKKVNKQNKKLNKQLAKLVTDPTGGVAGSYVQPVTASVGSAVKNVHNTLRDSITGFAQQFVGVPYVWGGNDLTKGVDCSGLVQQVYKQFGISLPRTANEQSKAAQGYGVKTSVNNLQPGDLMFWQNNMVSGSPQQGGVGHVAIYLGNGKYIDAQQPGTAIQVRTVPTNSSQIFGVHFPNLDRGSNGFPKITPVPRSQVTPQKKKAQAAPKPNGKKVAKKIAQQVLNKGRMTAV